MGNFISDLKKTGQVMGEVLAAPFGFVKGFAGKLIQGDPIGGIMDGIKTAIKYGKPSMRNLGNMFKGEYPEDSTFVQMITGEDPVSKTKRIVEDNPYITQDPNYNALKSDVDSTVKAINSSDTSASALANAARQEMTNQLTSAAYLDRIADAGNLSGIQLARRGSYFTTGLMDRMSKSDSRYDTRQLKMADHLEASKAGVAGYDPYSGQPPQSGSDTASVVKALARHPAQTQDYVMGRSAY